MQKPKKKKNKKLTLNQKRKRILYIILGALTIVGIVIQVVYQINRFK